MTRKALGVLGLFFACGISAAMAQVAPDAQSFLIDSGLSGGIFSGGIGVIKNAGYLICIAAGAVLTPIGLMTHKWGLAAAGGLAGIGGLAVSPVAMAAYRMVPHW